MDTTTTKILLIEDNPGDARWIQELLKNGALETSEIVCVQRLSEATARLAEEPFDLVLLDLSLPDSKGLETFQKIYQSSPLIPIIVLTGHHDEAMASDAVRQGAQDYLVKGDFDGNLLARAIRYAIQRKDAELELRESERRYEQAALENSRLYLAEIQRTNELARSNKLIAALSQVAARMVAYADPETTMETMGSELIKLGITCLIALYDAQDDSFRIRYSSQDQSTINKVEKFFNKKMLDYRIPRTKSTEHLFVDKEVGDPKAYLTKMGPLVDEVLSGMLPQLMKRALKLLRITPETQVIYAPLSFEDQLIGILGIWGPNLKSADIPAVSVFANQVAIALHNAHLHESVRQELSERMQVEKKLRLTQFTVDHVADNVLWLQPDAKLIYVNNAVCKALGRTREDLLKGSFPDLCYGSTTIANWSHRLAEVRLGGHLTFEDQFLRANGELFPVEIVINHIKFGDQELLCAIVRDITERKLIEDQLRHQAEHLDEALSQRMLELAGERIRTRTILEALGEAVLVSDHDRNIQYANQAALELSGFNREELLSQRMHLWRSPRQTSELSTHDLGQVKNGRSWRVEVTNTRKDGTPYDAAVTIAPMVDPYDKERTLGYVSVIRDITALKEAQRVKYRFVSNVSHELRTPLSIMTIMADNLYALYSELDDEKRRKLAKEIRDHTLSLNDLVTSVLEISRIDNGEIPYAQKLLDLAQITLQEVEKLSPLATRKNQTLTADGSDQLFIQGNDGQLRQIIRNLVNNAIKYTQEGGKIRCEFREINGHSDLEKDWRKPKGLPGGKWASLRVIDNGRGINPDHLMHIFERFYRIDSEGTIPGAGLGLSIAKELVELHNGYITVLSKEHEGSEFTVYFPLFKE